MSPADQWGPFALDLDPCEYRARLRTLRTIASMRLGPRGTGLTKILHACEIEPDLLDIAVDVLNRLPSLDRRGVLASYLKISMEKDATPF
ncbi:hypothetical protein [Methylobacterium sp. 10]|uniref:hypothetical protein n=1 Tax=Methylobacterium sp. 10 TaxID=1101191 RepID=UPI0012DEBE70|nr:hypothetical protein [Methylobacterium sp. 10]